MDFHSQVIDRILSDVCLDERVKDGIFRLDENDHIDALRDYLIKNGLTLEESISITNQMVEAKYPHRQAKRTEDGIIVTWATPEKMAAAIKKNPGKYIPLTKLQKKEEPKEQKPQVPIPNNVPDVQKDSSKPPPEQPIPQSVFQGDKELQIEPIRGPEKVETPPKPPEPPVDYPKTPEKVAAEKEVVKQMMKTDDTALTSLTLPPLSENCYKQLKMLLNYAEKNQFNDACQFLKHVI